MGIGGSGRGLKLTSHLLITPRSRTRGAIPTPPILLYGVVLSLAQEQLYLTYEKVLCWC